jgi:hypothetical protein
MPTNIYMLNLGFTLQGPTPPAANGSFQSYVSGNPALQTSSAWLNYNGGPPFPSWATDNCRLLDDATIGTTWAVLQPDYSPTNPYLSANSGDFLLVRVFTSDSGQAYRVRLGAVFGQGSDTPMMGNVVQSPLQLVPWTVARSIIDLPEMPPQNYPASSDGGWVFLFGQLHGALANYSLNVGAGIYDPSTGNRYALGRDPNMRVGGNVAKTVAA